MISNKSIFFIFVFYWLCFSVKKLLFFVFEILIEIFFEYRKVFLEIVCDKVFQIIIAIENRKNLNKRYKFENITKTILKKERLNSNCFIEYCELNTNDYSKNFVESNNDFQKFTKATMKKK